MLAPLETLVRALAHMPGLGRRSAGRAALALVREPERLLDPLVLALREARAEIVCCSCCGAFTVRSENPCAYCTDATRDGASVCVVEEPADIQTIESSGAFRGRYHVLGGKLSPVRHLGPEKLRIADCALVVCTKEQEEAVCMVAVDVAMIRTAQEGDGETADAVSGGTKDALVINAAEYKM